MENARGASPDRHRSEVPLLSDVQRAGHLCRLSPHAPAPAPPGTRKGSRWGRLSRSWLPPTPPPPARVGLCAPGQLQEQMPVGGRHTEVGLKP